MGLWVTVAWLFKNRFRKGRFEVCHTAIILTTLDITSVNDPLQMFPFQCYVTSSRDNLQNHQSEMHKVGIVAGFKGVNYIKLSLCRFYMLCWFVTHAAPQCCNDGQLEVIFCSSGAFDELQQHCRHRRCRHVGYPSPMIHTNYAKHRRVHCFKCFTLLLVL